MSRRYLIYSGIFTVTFFYAHLTTILEVAIIRHVDGVRYVSGNIIKLVHMLTYNGL